MYTGQKTAKGNSQPGASPDKYANFSEKDDHFLFSWHFLIKLQSTGTNSIMYARIVIIFYVPHQVVLKKIFSKKIYRVFFSFLNEVHACYVSRY